PRSLPTRRRRRPAMPRPRTAALQACACSFPNSPPRRQYPPITARGQSEAGAESQTVTPLLRSQERAETKPALPQFLPGCRDVQPTLTACGNLQSPLHRRPRQPAFEPGDDVGEAVEADQLACLVEADQVVDPPQRGD